MKNSFLKALITFIFLPALLSAQGIEFQHDLSWKQLLAKAKESNKVIFVDAFTTWCGPCKMMAKNVFPDKEVGEYFNATFVNAKIDMEKGEGPDIAQKYAVRAYPTYLFVNGDGELVHSGLGYMPAPDFLNLAKAAGDPSKQFNPMKKRWEKGDRSAEFLYEFTEQVSQNEPFNTDLMKEVSEAYIGTQKDLLTVENATYLVRYATSPDSKGFQYMVEHADQLDAVIGKGAAEGAINQVMLNDIFTQFPPTDGDMPFEEISTYTRQKYPAKYADKLISELKLNYLMTQNNLKTYAEQAIAHVEKYGKNDAMVLNQVAWSFYENIDKKSYLKKALGWALRSVELENAYFNNDTVAALYYKLGKMKEAKAYAEKAIDIAKATNQDFSDTQEMLDKIK